jgi:actin-like ATPase involved in cell morphogenesis
MDIGIDLGTTFSTIGVVGRVALNPEYGEGIYIEECDVTIIPGPYNEQTFPSVAIEDPENPGQLLFGRDALNAVDVEYAPIMFSKRKMGTNEILRTGIISLTAGEVAAGFLSYLRQCAEKALGVPVERAVVTHPAYFDRVAVEQTREAAITAGFDMERMEQMLMEPVAAALAYTRTDKRDPLNVLTYDLGGGTFDVTVLQRSGGVIDMKAFDGDHLLGGYNFDRELVGWIRSQLEKKGRVIALDMATEQGQAAVAALLRSAEGFKKDLSRANDDERKVEFRARGVIKDISGRDVPINEWLSRKEFVAMIRSYLERTVECCKNALYNANLTHKDIDEVLLVGGSSYGPWVKEVIQPLFPQVTPRLFSPDLCVAVGAAIHAAMVLPRRISVQGLSVQLDVPERTVLDSVSIAGEIMLKDSRSLSGCFVRLLNSEGNEIYDATLNPDNKFFFSDIKLTELDDTNTFTIQLADPGNKVILSQEFVVVHESDGLDTSAVTTVLPRPLFVDTYDGLVPLAKEGVALPARINSTFRRLNSNPSFDLQLYQAGEVIGAIRIEDVPPEGGEGSLVELQIEVTQKNEIRGKAIITSKDKSFQTERKIAIRYNIVEIPEVDRLSKEILGLKQKVAALELSPDLGNGEIIAPATINQAKELLLEGERLLAQVPLERQEVYAVQRKIIALLQPPQDDMRPSRREFFNLLIRCRTICEEILNTAKRIAGDSSTSMGLDPSMVRSAERSIHIAESNLRKLDEFERVALDAAEKRDKRKWLQIHDKLRRIEAKIRKDEEKQIAPTRVNKLIAKRDLIAMLKQFFAAAALIETNGKIKDWSMELRRIHKSLVTALLAIHEIDENLTMNRVWQQFGKSMVRLNYCRRILTELDMI